MSNTQTLLERLLLDLVLQLPSVKNIILFGAGASYGSGGIVPRSPPLGGGLFDELRRHYPTTWGALPDPHPAAFAADFEPAMQAVMESGQHWIGPLMQSMGLFFCSFRPVPARTDLYSQLLDRLSSRALRSLLLSTLNYECVLELAASQLGLRVEYKAGGHLSAQSVRVWKLHGSCNFVPNPQEVALRRRASYEWGMTINVTLLPVDPTEAARWINGDNALYPAMCMFTLNKPSQISPAVFAEYQTAWGSIVRGAQNVVTIGVRPHAPDEHIWGPLGDTSAHVHFVGSRQEFNRWRRKREGRPTSFLSDRFANALDSVTDIVDL